MSSLQEYSPLLQHLLYLLSKAKAGCLVVIIINHSFQFNALSGLPRLHASVVSGTRPTRTSPSGWAPLAAS